MSRGKILVIDDDEDLLQCLGVRLKASGYEIVFAIDAILAIGVAKKERPDLILLDIGLPGGDGFLIMERLKSTPSLALTPIIILTARDPEKNRKRALRAGAISFFQKPIDHDALLSAIRKALQVYGSPVSEAKDETDANIRRVLIVDDDKDVLRTLGSLLRTYNYDVTYASDATLALTAAQKEEPDVAILDIGLPGGDGFKVMERLQFLPKPISIIIMTGKDMQDCEERVLNAGAVAFFQKPVKNYELLAAIEKALVGRK